MAGFLCYYFGTITAVAALDLEVYTLRPLELLVKTNHQPITCLYVNAMGHVAVKLKAVI